MAIAATTVWEVRATATANNVNGGGFNSANAAPGTDYSQQDAAQKTHNDLVLADGDAVPGVVTSAAHPFTADDNGNIIHITAGTGFTAGWYEIVSVDGSGNATLDRQAGTSDGEKTGGTYYMGGAMSLSSSLDDDFIDVVAAGNTVWIKAGTYTPGESMSPATPGTAAGRTKFLGYNTTRGDNPTGDNRPVLNFGASSYTTGTYWQVENIRVTGTATSQFSLSASAIVNNVKVRNQSGTANKTAFFPTSTPFNAFRGDFSSLCGYAISFSGYGNIVGCYIHDSMVGARNTGSTSPVPFVGCIFENCITADIQYTGAQTYHTLVFGNTFYGSENKLGIAVSLASGCANYLLLNNVFYGFVTALSHGDASSANVEDFNAFNNNTTDRSGFLTGLNSITTNPAFTSVSQITGTAGSIASANKLIDTSKNFTTLGVVAGDVVYVTGGTGATTGLYLIDSISTTTNPNDTLNITLPASIGTNATGDVAYQITVGHNFLPTGSV